MKTFTSICLSYLLALVAACGTENPRALDELDKEADVEAVEQIGCCATYHWVGTCVVGRHGGVSCDDAINWMTYGTGTLAACHASNTEVECKKEGDSCSGSSGAWGHVASPCP